MCPRNEGRPCGGGRGGAGHGRGRGRGGEGRGAGGGRGLLEPAVLVVLARGATHGYDLRSAVEGLTSGLVAVDPGGLYRVLRRMEDAGLVTSIWTEGEHGPQRRTYAITDVGRDELCTWAGRLQRRRRVVNELLDALGDLGMAMETENDDGTR